MQLWEVKWFSYIVTLMNEDNNSFRKKKQKKKEIEKTLIQNCYVSILNE